MKILLLASMLYGVAAGSLARAQGPVQPPVCADLSGSWALVSCPSRPTTAARSTSAAVVIRQAGCTHLWIELPSFMTEQYSYGEAMVEFVVGSLTTLARTPPPHTGGSTTLLTVSTADWSEDGAELRTYMGFWGRASDLPFSGPPVFQRRNWSLKNGRLVGDVPDHEGECEYEKIAR